MSQTDFVKNRFTIEGHLFFFKVLERYVFFFLTKKFRNSAFHNKIIDLVKGISGIF